MLHAFEIAPTLFARLAMWGGENGQPASLDTASAAKLIRHLLRAAFPAVRFTVRTSRYAGGSSIDIRWTDGPSYARVDDLVSALEGRGFDGMQDLAYQKGPFVVNGVAVRTSCYIHCQRERSDALRQKAAQQVARYFGCEAPALNELGHTVGPDGQHYWETLVYQACEDRSRFALG